MLRAAATDPSSAIKGGQWALARRERTFMVIMLDLMVADAALGALDESVGCVATRGGLSAFDAMRRTIGHHCRASVAMRSKKAVD